ncbi:hypothetical protein NQ176_g358 [Zarea fungicola]|uniref:Uncharacterized protein n=1 Tax=Zarea fungicola TaxID=93591 RepID=A0ACC1NYH6_9HYPO|nr:hypothetical protein NQ176_g358 [Lecanicillium fungicola]
MAAVQPPSSIFPANGTPSHLATGNTEALDPTSATPATTALSKTDALHRGREISTPPLRQSQIQAGPQKSTSNPVSAPPSTISRATNGVTQWNIYDLSKALQRKLVDVRKDHSCLVTQVIEGTSPAELLIQHGKDLFPI